MAAVETTRLLKQTVALCANVEVDLACGQIAIVEDAMCRIVVEDDEVKVATYEAVGARG